MVQGGRLRRLLLQVGCAEALCVVPGAGGVIQVAGGGAVGERWGQLASGWGRWG